LNRRVFASSLRRPSMRRILSGLKVVRPRCAAGAPPRPRLRSTAPSTGRNEARTKEMTNRPIFTGAPNTDKESVSRVNRISAGVARGRDDLVHRQVGPHRMTDLADLIGLVGQSVRRVAVLIRIHRDGGNAQFVGGAESTDGDLSAVGDQDLRDHAGPNMPGCPAVATVPSGRPRREKVTGARPFRWSFVRRLRPASA
jgi:hypothetical protein